MKKPVIKQKPNKVINYDTSFCIIAITNIALIEHFKTYTESIYIR